MTVTIPADKRQAELPAASRQPEGAIHRQPVTFQGLFGWLHTSATHPPGDVAVLICPAVTRDGLDSHLAVRVMADELAAAGYPALRFNYPGTGDSLDAADTDFAAGNQFQSWLASVQAAADWLKSTTGAQRLILCGLRFGATIAALATQPRTDIAGLLLLAPVLRGKSYLRQLWVETGLRIGAVGTQQNGLDLEELDFNALAIQMIEKIDLRHVKLGPATKLAIFPQAPSKIVDECLEAWNSRGTECLLGNFDALAPMLSHDLEGEGQVYDLSAPLNWIIAHIPSVPRPTGYVAPLPPARLVLKNAAETPLQFGADNRLFGILCTPERRISDSAVLILNAGRDPHYGNARFGTFFARQLAASGIASLRMDFSGLGDSIGALGKENILSYVLETDRSTDIKAALDLLQQNGYSSFTLHGICGGAYHAFHAALADDRIRMLLLVNLPLFSWNAGESVNLIKRQTLPLRHYTSKIFDQKIWQRALNSDIEIRHILAAQFTRLRRKLSAIKSKSDHAPTFERLAMASLAKRGIKSLFLFHRDNGGLDVFEQSFGKNGISVLDFQGTTIKIIAEPADQMRYDQALFEGGHIMLDYLNANPLGLHAQSLSDQNPGSL